MMSQESMMKKKLENMHLKERIDYGYRKVITMMLISGLLSVVIIGVLFANMMHYVENVNVADQAVKICRINVNAAARNIREMALNEDTSSYDNYEQTVKRLLSEVDSELQILKKTEVLSDENYEEYATALSDWGKIGYSIIEEIKNGNDENATDAILNNCTPALNKVVEIAIKLDELTDEASSETVRNMVVCTVAGFVVIIVCLVFAFTLTRKTSKRVLCNFLLVTSVYLVYLAVVSVLHFCLFPLFGLYLSLQISYILLQTLILRFQPLDLAAAQKRTYPVRYGCGCVHRRPLHLLHVDFSLDLFQFLLCFLFQPQQGFYVLLQAVLLLY